MGVQMGEIFRPGWLIGWATRQVYELIPCVSWTLCSVPSAKFSLLQDTFCGRLRMIYIYIYMDKEHFNLSSLLCTIIRGFNTRSVLKMLNERFYEVPLSVYLLMSLTLRKSLFSKQKLPWLLSLRHVICCYILIIGMIESSRETSCLGTPLPTTYTDFSNV
jgi:hypothetical protein